MKLLHLTTETTLDKQPGQTFNQGKKMLYTKIISKIIKAINLLKRFSPFRVK